MEGILIQNNPVYEKGIKKTENKSMETTTFNSCWLLPSFWNLLLMDLVKVDFELTISKPLLYYVKQNYVELRWNTFEELPSALVIFGLTLSFKIL